jgi:hypothetical protein
MGQVEHGLNFYFGVSIGFDSSNSIYNMGDFILESWHLLVLLLAILFATFQLVKWRDLLTFLNLLLVLDAQCFCMLNFIF